MMTSLFGGGKAQREAQRQAEESRKMQQVANDRQLAELRSQEVRGTASRRNPRGRRLFVENVAEKTNLS